MTDVIVMDTVWSEKPATYIMNIHSHDDVIKVTKHENGSKVTFSLPKSELIEFLESYNFSYEG